MTEKTTTTALSKEQSTLATEVSACHEGDLPHEPDLLDARDFAVLTIDDRETWRILNPSGRAKLLQRAHHRSRVLERKRATQVRRQELCAEYIDALCTLGEVDAVDRPAARVRYEQAKTDWEAFRALQPSRR